MHSLYHRLITSTLLFTMAASTACDPIDEDQAIDLSGEELLADDDADPSDDAAPYDDLPLDELAEAPDPVAGYYDCPESAGFCFWTQIKYGGDPTTLPKGDFSIKSFDAPIKSMLKRNGTYRVKVYSHANFQGNCAVFGVPDKYADSPNLAFPVKSAKRIEPWEPGC